VNSIKSVPYHQRGMTTIGLILVVGTIGFFVTLAIKLTPVYLESFQISSIFKSLEQDMPMADATNQEIRSSLARRFDVNNIENVKPKQVDIRRKNDRVTALALKYETRVPMFWNIDVVVRFDKDVEVGH